MSPVRQPALRPDAPSAVQIAASLGIGGAALMISAISPLILGQYHRLGRLSSSEIGLSAMAEALTMGLICGAAGGVLKARNLRRIALTACLIAALSDIVSANTAHLGFLFARAGAGLGEGIMLWIAIALIARQPTPERTAALFLTGQVIAALVVTTVCATWVQPVWGAAGDLMVLSATAGLGAIAAFWSPDRLTAATAEGEQAEGLPPLRGWISLGVMFTFVSAGAGVYVYLDPIAQTMQLGPGAVAAAVQANLIAQILGGGAAVAMAGRIRYPLVIAVTGCVAISVYTGYLLGLPVAGFVLATGLTGFFGMLLTPFFVPMSLAADPGRRAAAMAGGAQVLGSAGGPLAAALAGGQARMAVILGIGWVVLCVAIGLWLAFTHKPTETSAVR